MVRQRLYKQQRSDKGQKDMEVKTPHRQGQWRSRHLTGGRGQTKVRQTVEVKQQAKLDRQ